MVALRKARLTKARLAALPWVLALTLCLGIGLHLAMPGTAWGLSGFASGGSAVAAQYPDSAAAQSAGPKPDISDLAEVMAAIGSSRPGDPAQSPAQQLEAYQAVVHRELQAVSSVPGFGLRQTGSIALLIAAMAVLLVGGVLRWRRGHP
jgi:hypothetical protein